MDHVGLDGDSLEAATAPLTLRLFGRFEARVRGVPISRLRTRKGEWLLALLALRRAPVERAWLAGTLWPDSPEPLSLRSLRTALADLRRALGPEAVRIHAPTPRTLALDLTETDVDVVAFDAAIASGTLVALEEAVALHRAPLLEGCPETWALHEREVREQAYLGALETLADRALATGDPATAEGHLRRVVAVDPLRESGQRALMRAMAAGGGYAAAMQVYRELRLRLHREMSVAPDPETRALFEQIREQACRRATSAGRRTSPARRHDLSLALTSFIGRTDQIAEVRALLTHRRLVTLIGAGGCGKTRLALEVARSLSERFADGVWVVELAALADPSFVPQRVAAALELREEPVRPLTATLIRAIEERELLLLLDNCEHLVAACANLAEALLRACPGLRILSTSRESLGIAGEVSYRVPSLSLPPAGTLHADAPGVEALARYEAVRLFIDRATTALPEFAVTAENARAVVTICRRLDGIALAIELAAARVKALPVGQIATRLDDCFRLLTGGSRTALPRHQTLQASIDWSYALLAEPERVLLRRLSVFRGGWTLEAAEAICGEEVLALLPQLVDKSLVQYEEGAGVGRYRLLETIWQYGWERLGESRELGVLCGRHRDWYLSLAEAAEDRRVRGERDTWTRCLEADEDNLRAALARDDAEPGAGEKKLRLAGTLAYFWASHGYLSEGRRWLDRALAQSDGLARTQARARALCGAGSLARHQGDYAAARPCLEESLAISREIRYPWGTAWSLFHLGQLARNQDEHAHAYSLLGESLALCREHGFHFGAAWSLNSLGVVAGMQGDATSARSFCEDALRLFRQMQDDAGIAWSLLNLGDIARSTRDCERAVALYRECLPIFRSLELGWGLAAAFESLAGAVAMGEPERTAGLLAAAESLRGANRVPISPADQREYESLVAATRAALGEEIFTTAWIAGRSWTMEEAVAVALAELEAQHQQC